MTAQFDDYIQKALCAHLESGALGYLISWPFVPFTPTPGTAYLDVQPLLVAQPMQLAMGFNGSVVHRGVFQIDAIVPDNGSGETTGRTLAGLVEARFAIGTTLVAGSRKLKIPKQPTTAAAVTDAPWLRFPVSVPYQLVE